MSFNINEASLSKMITDFGDRDDDEADLAATNNAAEDNGSLSSEDSQEPYYHVTTGKIVPAREAWAVLAKEGHPRYQSKLGGGGGNNQRRNSNNSSNNRDSVFRSPTETIQNDTPQLLAETPPPSNYEGEESSEFDIHPVASFTGPTQSSIDKALHPESPNYISPNKDILQKKPSDSGGPMMMDGYNSDEDEKETDPIILRAKAMALAAQNGQKLTPEQMLLIAQPDVQQQKLIEEAKRVQKAKEMQHSQQQLESIKQIGADFKKFIQEEKEKPPMQWGADLGKFIESTSLKIGGVHGTPGNDGGGEGDEDESSSAAGGAPMKPRASPTASPKSKKKMEGFGSSPIPVDEGPTPSASVKNLWSSVNMPPLPMLNDTITNILPGANKDKQQSGEGDTARSADTIPPEEEPVRISGILWKRRSGFGKHSTIKAWERRRVELRGSKLLYYRTAEEKEEEEDRSTAQVSAAGDGNAADDNNTSGLTTPRDPSEVVEQTDTITLGSNNNSEPSSITSYNKKLSIFGQAAQAAEQRIQTATKELTRLASVTGLDSLKPTSIAADNTPRGILDLVKEKASVSASMGHSGSPTPFCVSIKIKSETKWKFCFDTHSMMMEWLAAVSDVIVKSSVDMAAGRKNEGGSTGWELEDYCIRRRSGEGKEEDNEQRSDKRVAFVNGNATVLSTTQTIPLSAGVVAAGAAAVVSSSKDTQWMISGNNLYIAWAMANVALIIARSSSTSIDQYWMLVVFANVGLWQLCTRPKVVSVPESSSVAVTEQERLLASVPTAMIPKKGLHRPTAGNSTIQVTKVDDPNINEKGHQLPTWIPISSSIMDVRSHGYLTTKKKIPSPGELYECVAVDTFVSNNRFPEIAPRMKFGEQFHISTDNSSTKKTWKSPDIFIVSISIPTEAPSFGKSTDDGRGLTIVGYFKMKEETRAILQRVTADGYDPSTDTTDATTDIQKRITNGVRLWERYCKEAPKDPSFQARFKLIPSGNLEELGLPSYISKYNGKPVLIKRNQVTGFFTDYPSLNVMEFDISLHPFPYLFKQAMAYLKDYFDNVNATFGFVIEGRDDDELPEVVIGALKLCRPSPKYIVSGERFFAGTCPKSC